MTIQYVSRPVRVELIREVDRNPWPAPAAPADVGAASAAPENSSGATTPEPSAAPPAKSAKGPASHPRRAKSCPSSRAPKPSSLSYHQRNCTICHHPDRDAIEQAFLQWRSVSNIRFEFKLPSRTTVYSHAHAFGLFPQRGRLLRSALEHIIECAETITPTGEAIIRAVKAYTCLDDAGQWIEPPAHVIVSSGSAALHPRPQLGTPVRTENDATL
jgi:hypothetical protein